MQSTATAASTTSSQRGQVESGSVDAKFGQSQLKKTINEELTSHNATDCLPFGSKDSPEKCKRGV
jgi:hypothetical protein